MRIVTTDGYLTASYITGPSHNTLWLRLTDTVVHSAPIVEALPPAYPSEGSSLNAQEVVAAVLYGIDHVNTVLRTNYAATAIRYLPDDTPRYIIYSVIAHHLTIFKRAEQLRTQDTSTCKKIFHIANVRPMREGSWRVEGHSWGDLRTEDVVFAAIERDTWIAYEIGIPPTAHQAGGELDANRSGELILHGPSQYQMKPNTFLYR